MSRGGPQSVVAEGRKSVVVTVCTWPEVPFFFSSAVNVIETISRFLAECSPKRYKALAKYQRSVSLNRFDKIPY